MDDGDNELITSLMWFQEQVLMLIRFIEYWHDMYVSGDPQWYPDSMTPGEWDEEYAEFVAGERNV